MGGGGTKTKNGGQGTAPPPREHFQLMTASPVPTQKPKGMM